MKQDTRIQEFLELEKDHFGIRSPSEVSRNVGGVLCVIFYPLPHQIQPVPPAAAGLTFQMALFAHEVTPPGLQLRLEILPSLPCQTRKAVAVGRLVAEDPLHIANRRLGSRPLSVCFIFAHFPRGPTRLSNGSDVQADKK